ncbi:MAG TPA: LLM class flavin-dependent oxidoreductase [Candidatus Microbacterium stercoravium]|uniref:LLM class flavin-dependent oxidoreductase n=1 Tax=Candidatus Microbacterium stercoravium TaxID=2838697 RepID=A0A9D2H490_9MICO|nr:LLM class flavin-dependent oxidoreductase [Candidatus Microbacterium stercoravium]
MAHEGIRLHWYLPTAGESRDVQRGGTNVRTLDDEAPRSPFRAPSLSYLTQVALAVEEAGFDSVLVPTGSFCEDPWVVASALAAVTRRLRLLVALHPRTATAVSFAHRAASLQRLSGGRLALNVVTGEPGAEAEQHGDFGDKADQYLRTAEFLDAYDALFRGESIDREGAHVTLRGASLDQVPSVGIPARPEVWFGGSSSYAGDVAARYVDVYLSWLEPVEQLREKIAWIRELAAEQGRDVRFGVRGWILARDTHEQAERDALALLEGIDRGRQAALREKLLARQSVGQQRGQALIAGADVDDPSSLWVAPGIWGGFGLLAGGAATGFVGSHAEIADRFAELSSIGVHDVIVSGFPNLEETRWMSDGLVPELARRGLLERGECR